MNSIKGLMGYPPGRTGFVVLLYHHITPTGREPFSISQDAFYNQVRWLVAGGYQIVPLGEFPGGHCEARRVFITFDDGYEDVYHYVFPVLKHFGAAATLFLITDYIGKTNDWEHPGLPRYRHLTENQISELCAAGWEMHSHTASHRNFRRMPLKEIRDDVSRAKKVLQEWNPGPLFCAYPAGRSEPRLAHELHRQGYRGAFGAEPGSPMADGFHLGRIPVTSNDLTYFIRLMTRDA
jgi:peptidoglycan/xylan/chitin deacetylase (PgdA/CDA1 family)